MQNIFLNLQFYGHMPKHDILLLLHFVITAGIPVLLYCIIVVSILQYHVYLMTFVKSCKSACVHSAGMFFLLVFFIVFCPLVQIGNIQFTSKVSATYSVRSCAKTLLRNISAALIRTSVSLCMSLLFIVAHQNRDGQSFFYKTLFLLPLKHRGYICSPMIYLRRPLRCRLSEVLNVMKHVI